MTWNTTPEMKKHIEHNGKVRRVCDAITEAIEETNGMTDDGAVAKGIFNALIGQHRTLQQAFIKEFADAMKLYVNAHYDARNEASIEFAKKIADMNHPFPFI